jgi:hypothetical protein
VGVLSIADCRLLIADLNKIIPASREKRPIEDVCMIDGSLPKVALLQTLNMDSSRG